MGVMVLVGIASLGGLFMVAFLVALSHEEAHPKRRPHIVRSALAKSVPMTSTLRTPLQTRESSVRRRSLDAEPQQRVQAR
jgi:hypothetical protein